MSQKPYVTQLLLKYIYIYIYLYIYLKFHLYLIKHNSKE